MSGVLLQTVAQISVEHILNALPEGFLIAIFAWALLRVLRRQNSGTRFVVWFLALLTVAVLPLLAAFGGGRALPAAGMLPVRRGHAITMPAYWALFVFLAWVVGASVAMIRLAIGLWRLRQLRRSCIPIVDGDLDPMVRQTLRQIGGSNSVESGSVRSRAAASSSMSITIATSEYVRVPAAIGFFKKTIVLPAWTLRELPAKDLNVILLHEFAHLRRCDDWTNLVQKIVLAVFFFHPAVWWIEKQLSVQREMACDDAVLAQTSNPRGYAACLVSLLEKSLAHRPARGWSMAQAAVHRAREAALRLARILDTNRPVATRVWKPAVGMIIACALVCLMTLPLLPQFVAFDRGGVGGNSNHAQITHAYSIASGESSLTRPAIIPAPSRTEGFSPAGAAKVVRTHAVGGHKPASANLVASRMEAAEAPNQVVEASENSEEVAPRLQTLVLIEATQYGTSGASLWSVQVWRVTLVSATRERIARVPVAKSI